MRFRPFPVDIRSCCLRIAVNEYFQVAFAVQAAKEEHFIAFDLHEGGLRAGYY